MGSIARYRNQSESGLWRKYYPKTNPNDKIIINETTTITDNIIKIESELDPV